MAYNQGGKIEATDFNTFCWGGSQGIYRSTPANVAYVMGVGNGEFGYGQNIIALNNVSLGNTVTASQWSGFTGVLNNALGHQSGAGAQLTYDPPITTGNVITYYNTIATAVQQINDNRQLYAASGTGDTGSWVSNTINTTASFNNNYNRTIAFSSVDAMRWFFNAGGRLTFRVSASDIASTTRSTTIRAMINSAAGVANFANFASDGRIGSSSYGILQTNDTTFGHRDIAAGGTAYTLVQLRAPSGSYSTDTVQLQVYTDTYNTINGGIASNLIFRLRINANASAASFNDRVNLSLQTRIDITYPSTAYLTPSWGTPTRS